jgi:branched-subunit amino acid transport protein AzlD
MKNFIKRLPFATFLFIASFLMLEKFVFENTWRHSIVLSVSAGTMWYFLMRHLVIRKINK